MAEPHGSAVGEPSPKRVRIDKTLNVASEDQPKISVDNIFVEIKQVPTVGKGKVLLQLAQ